MIVNISTEICKKSNIAVRIALQWFEGSPFLPVYINSPLVKCIKQCKIVMITITFPLKCNNFFWLFYISLKLVLVKGLCTLVSSCETIITIIFSYYNHSFQTNEGPLFIIVAYNAAPFHLLLFNDTLYLCCYCCCDPI